jgi:starch-binding outer membrane protein, SusD/RagB family
MKKKFIYIVTIMLVLFTTACEDSLDVPNSNEADEQNFWKSGNDALLAVNAVYGNAYRNGAYARWLSVYLSVRSDDGVGTSGWGELRSVSDFTQVNYNFEAARNIWAHHYRGIFRTNQVIAYVPAIEMDESLKRRYIAEAQFFRALYYFNLVNLWGEVPLVLRPSNPTDLPSQATIPEIYGQIEADLQEAVQYLPLFYDNANIGRVTRGAAYALLGKAYLQQGKHQAAADAFEFLVEGEGKPYYGLVENYRDNFLHTTENNIESVFEIQFKDLQSVTDEDDPNSNLGNQRGPFFAPPNAGFNDMQMHRWVIDEFLEEETVDGERDPRLESTALFNFTNEGGPDNTIVYGRTFTELLSADDQRVWYRKYLNDYHRTGETFEGPINLRVIRFADVLLMYAEALNGIGQTEQAYQYVDRVRERAGLAKLSEVKPGLDDEAFLEQLKHERVTELTGEDVRWLDLVRWGYFDDQNKINELKTRDPEFNNFDLSKHKWIPIPQSEIDINPNLRQVGTY